MQKIVKENATQIQKYLNSYSADKVRNLFFLFSKFIAVNEDFRVVVEGDYSEVEELIHEENPAKIVFDLASEMSPEDIALLKEIMTIEINETKVTKKKAVELMAKALANDVLFEGMCLGVSSTNEMLAEICGSFGCANRFALLLEDEVFCRRREYFQRICDYTKAAVNLYGVIFIKELLQLMAMYEKWPANGDVYVKKTGSYRTTLFYSPEYFSMYVVHHIVGDDIPEVVCSVLGYVMNMAFKSAVLKEIEQMKEFGRRKGRVITEAELGEFHKLTSGSEYRVLYETAQNKDMYLPDKDTFLRYADEWYLEESAAVIRLQKYLKDHYGKQIQREAMDDSSPEAAAKELALSLQLMARDNCYTSERANPGELAQAAFSELEHYGIKMKNLNETNEFLGYLMDLANSTRLWANHGHTPDEMRNMLPHSNGPITVVPGNSDAARILQEADEQLREMGVRVDLESNATEVPAYRYRSDTQGTVTKEVKKVYPNDPCPCGSGKKFKKCCGKG